jgi:hypothetical protein
MKLFIAFLMAWLVTTPLLLAEVALSDTVENWVNRDSTSTFITAFSEDMSIVGLDDAANWSVTDETGKEWKIWAVGIVLEENGKPITGNRKIILVTERVDYKKTYTVRVNNVTDVAGNTIDSLHNSMDYTFVGFDADMQIPNVALNIDKLVIATATSQKTSEANHGPLKAIDGKTKGSGDVDSRWACNPIPVWIKFDLGQIRSVYELHYSFYGFEQGRIYTYNVQYSRDNVTWNPLVLSKQQTPNVEWTIDKMPVFVDARYIRVQFTANTESTWAGLWEVEIWGK